MESPSVLKPNRTPHANTFAIAIRWLLPIAILSVGIASMKGLSSLKSIPEDAAPVAYAPLVVTEAIQSAPAQFGIDVHGTVLPKREVSLAAEVSGKLVYVSNDCRAGNYVPAGTALIKIDRRHYELEVRRLTIAVAQTDVDLLELQTQESNNNALIQIAETDLSISQREFQRIGRLAEKGSASISDRDSAESSLMKAQNTLQTLKNANRVLQARRQRLAEELKFAQARLAQAELDLEKTNIVAPIDGIVSEEFVEENVFVQPGSLLLKIEDTAAVEVKCNLRIEDLHWLEQSRGPQVAGDRNTIAFQPPRVPAVIRYVVAGKTYAWDGFLVRFEGIGLDAKTRTIPCRVEVPDPIHRGDSRAPVLRRGMFCRVELIVTIDDSLLEIPFRALRAGERLWVVRGNKLNVESVRVARMLEDRILLRVGAGIRAGDEVVVSPLSPVTDGMAVEVQKDGRP